MSKPIDGPVCPACNLHRAPGQFERDGFKFATCDQCRAKNPKLRKPIKSTKG